jgi:hypothetical protein
MLHVASECDVLDASLTLIESLVKGGALRIAGAFLGFCKIAINFKICPRGI